MSKKLDNSKITRKIQTIGNLPEIKINQDWYTTTIRLKKIYSFLKIEEFINNNLYYRGKKKNCSKIDLIRKSPMVLGILEELLNEKRAIVSTSTGFEFYVGICSFINFRELTVGQSVLMNSKTFLIVGFLKEEVNYRINAMKIDTHSSESFGDIGGLSEQIREIRETIELPLTHPEIFLKIGILPPKGIILYGDPGTGKTLLARAVANSTKACFLRISASELVQKFLGEGPRLVRDIFRFAYQFSPSVIFIDEVDAIGMIRHDTSSSGEKEVQRTMLELLNQLDGFDSKSNIKVIMATNRIGDLDPALIRPGRIDRKVELPLPDEVTVYRIFQVHLKKMNMDRKIKFGKFLKEKNGLTGADVKLICTEAALVALRSHRLFVCKKDLIVALNFIINKKRETFLDAIYM